MGKIGVLGLGSILALLILTAATAYGSPKKSDPSFTTVRLVFETPSSGNVTSFLALKEGFFKRNHIAIKIVQLPAGPQATAALVGGSIDVGQLGIENMAALLAHGQKMILISENSSNYWTLMTSPSLAGKPLAAVLQGLAGKTVSAPSVGGEGAGFLRYLESTYGMSQTSINLTADPSNSAVISGQSAAGMTDTVGACVLGTKGFKKAFSFADTPNRSYPSNVRALMKLPDIGYWVTGTYAATHPQVVKEFQTAIHQTIAWSQSHLAKAVNVLVQNQDVLGYPSMPGNAYPNCMKQIIEEGTTTLTLAQVKTWSNIVQIEKLSGPLPSPSQWAIRGVVLKGT